MSMQLAFRTMSRMALLPVIFASMALSASETLAQTTYPTMPSYYYKHTALDETHTVKAVVYIWLPTISSTTGLSTGYSWVQDVTYGMSAVNKTTTIYMPVVPATNPPTYTVNTVQTYDYHKTPTITPTPPGPAGAYYYARIYEQGVWVASGGVVFVP